MSTAAMSSAPRVPVHDAFGAPHFYSAPHTRLLCREWTLQNEYLRQKNKALRSKIGGRIVTPDAKHLLLAPPCQAKVEMSAILPK